MASPERALDGARPSPNIWHHPTAYETENRAFDRTGVLLSVMRDIADWADSDVLDIGCGTGFHLPVFATTAASVRGVEPNHELRALAERRTRRLANVSVLAGLADELPLPPASVDVAHARWAYFFGPGCEPGLAELDRVLRPGGTAFVIDNDPAHSVFGGWFRRGFPDVDPTAVADFWTAVDFGDVPAPDFSKDAELIAALSPEPIEGKRIDLTGDNMLPGLLAERANLKARSGADLARIAEIEAEIKFKMGDAEIATIDGFALSFKTQTRKPSFVKASTSRVLRITDHRQKEELNNGPF